jgi:hypothetical protein
VPTAQMSLFDDEVSPTRIIEMFHSFLLHLPLRTRSMGTCGNSRTEGRSTKCNKNPHRVCSGG